MSLRIRMRVTIPKQVYDAAAARQRLINALRHQTVPDLVHYFDGTVEGWQNKPTWGVRENFTAHSLSEFVYAQGAGAEQYALVNNGSPAHLIQPRTAGFLRFQPGYRAGTRPRTLTSRSFARFGKFVSAGEVQHPGFEAREFAQTIADTYYPQFVEDMQAAMRP